MELKFWGEKWEKGEIGFHQNVVNPYLSYFYDVKGPGSENRTDLKVFVPLCGKSADLHWLSTKGYAVLGIECSELAVEAFFKEQNVQYTKEQTQRFLSYASESTAGSVEESIEILLGDFFSLDTTDMGNVTDVFDRAALIALPEAMRKQYVDKMVELQKQGTRTLLITMTYPQDEMNGPPFSVSEEEINDLYATHFKIDKLLAKNILDDEPKFKERGLTSLTETAYKLTRL